MGRNKFEDQIKRKIGDREIIPSAGSWEKLSGQLNSEESKKGFSLWWVGVAVTILGAIFIAGFVYNSDPQIDSPGIVETPVQEIQKNIENITEKEPVNKKNAIASQIEKEENKILPEKQNTQIIKKKDQENIIAGLNEQESPGKIEVFDGNENLKISQKLEELIAEAFLKDQIEGEQDMNEIDALLYKAASEISLERMNTSTSGTVDAGDLLFAVEMELEESFREKVFDILKEGYLKARTAVANRNYP